MLVRGIVGEAKKGLGAQRGVRHDTGEGGLFGPVSQVPLVPAKTRQVLKYN